MKNPWEDIKLSDYESHMSLESVYQLQVLNGIMKEQFSSYDVESVMILGIAGGNGLEYMDKEKIRFVYGVDVNQSYLNECKKRYSGLGDSLKTICTDLSDDVLQLPCAQLLVANLLIEYIGYKCFQRIVQMVKPKYVSCVIQINTDDSFVSESPYLHVFDKLDEIHHQMTENSLTEGMGEIGYTKRLISERELPNGKKLVRIDYEI